MNRILTQGDPFLERVSEPVIWPDAALADEIDALESTLAAFRRRHGFGRAIAAPQLGIGKRLIVLELGAGPFAIINPEITWASDETFAVWDDCLSVPDTLVRVRRHQSVSVEFLDREARRRRWTNLPPDLSELAQHEIDHLDGILMTARAIDSRSIVRSDERPPAASPATRATMVGLEQIPHA